MFNLAAVEELQANLLEMPFLGDDVSFFALLPEGVNGLDETINRLTLDTLRDAMSRTFPVTVEVGLPKFRLEQNTNLRNVHVIPFSTRFSECSNHFIVPGAGQNGINGHVRFARSRFFRIQ